MEKVKNIIVSVRSNKNLLNVRKAVPGEGTLFLVGPSHVTSHLVLGTSGVELHGNTGTPSTKVTVGTPKNTAFQSVFPGPTSSHYLGTCWRYTFCNLVPDQLNQSV